MFSRAIASSNDIVKFVSSENDYNPQLSILDVFIDFFINLMGGETKFQHLKNLHQDIFGDSTPEKVLHSMIALKQYTHSDLHKDFHAELLFGDDFFCTGKASVCFYYKKVRIVQSEPIHYSTFPESQFHEHFSINPLLLGNSIASFSKATTEWILTEFLPVRSEPEEPIEMQNIRFARWFSEKLELFTFGLDLLDRRGRMPKEFQVQKYIKVLEELGEASNRLLNPIYFSWMDFTQLTDTTKTNVALVLNDLSANIASTIEKKSATFECSEFIGHRYILAEQLVTHLGQARYFYEGKFFASDFGTTMSIRTREMHIFNTAVRLVKNFYTQGMFSMKINDDVIPLMYRHAVANTVDMIDIYCQCASEKGGFVITLESHNNFDIDHGYYISTRVCLRHDGVLKKKFEIPPEFECLIIRNVAGKLCKPIERGTLYRVFYLLEDVTRNTFLSKVSDYFSLCEITDTQSGGISLNDM